MRNPERQELAAAAHVPPIDESAMGKLMRLLRDAYGIDFSHYKRTTVNRRIERRLLLDHTTDFESYVEQLAANPDEMNSLYRDLLIGVTQFFRDRDAFHELDQRILPELLQQTKPEDEIRMWVAGCATGEDAYSLAILLHEHLSRLKRPIHAKIFATDVHQASLDIAAVGCYEEDRLGDVSTERLKRYFTQKGQQYQVNSELRQVIVFAQHNLLKDAPFTRLNLVSCRNLLIYFQSTAQKRALSLFHFGLKPGDMLLLGPSEGLAGLEDEFSALDRQWKIYRKMRDSRLPPEVRLPTAVAKLPQTMSADDARNDRPHGRDGQLQQVYEELLTTCIPSGLLFYLQRPDSEEFKRIPTSRDADGTILYPEVDADGDHVHFEMVPMRGDSILWLTIRRETSPELAASSLRKIADLIDRHGAKLLRRFQGYLGSFDARGDLVTGPLRLTYDENGDLIIPIDE